MEKPPINKQPIKIPKPFVPSRFAIPLVEGVNEREMMKDFGQYTKLLETWGFERLLGTQSIDHSYLERGDYKGLENYELWQHPAGVLARLHSYTSGGYTRDNGSHEPIRHAMGSMHLAAKVDAGTGGEVQHRTSVGIRGSGGTTPLFDGRQVRCISDTVHSNTSNNLYDFMEMTQRHGRLLPFDQWGEDTDRMFFLYLSPELIAPVLEWPKDKPFKIEDMESRTMELIDRLPEALAHHFRKEAQLDAARKDPNKPKPSRGGPAWDPIEFGVNEFSEALFLARKRWPKPEESELLKHWSRVALGELGAHLDPMAMRAYEKGPAGLSLPVALLYAKQSAPLAPALLENLLQSAPIDALRRWATEPDAAGYTLGLRAIDRSFTERSIETHEPPNVDVLGLLHQRLGPEGLVMATPTRSVMGLALQPRGSEKKDWVRHAELAHAIERLDDWGVEWSSHLRWRNYPNLFVDKDKPAFFQLDGPVDPQQWKELLGSRYTTELDRVLSRLDRVRMEIDTPKAEASTRSGPRL